MSDLAYRVGIHFKMNCVTLEQIEEKVSEGTVADLLHPLETAFTHLPKYMINDKIAEKVIHGAVLAYS